MWCPRTFIVVNYLALVKLGHFAGVNTGIPNFSIYDGVFFALVSNGLQERRAARARASKHEAHFTGLQNTRRPDVA